MLNQQFQPKPYKKMKGELAHRFSFDLSVSTIATAFAHALVGLPRALLSAAPLSFWGANSFFDKREKFKYDSYCALVNHYNNKLVLTEEQLSIFNEVVEADSVPKQLLNACNPKAWSRANMPVYYSALGAIQCEDEEFIGAISQSAKKNR